MNNRRYLTDSELKENAETMERGEFGDRAAGETTLSADRGEFAAALEDS